MSENKTTTKRRRAAHVFDLDNTTLAEGAMWWVLDKEQPDKCLLRLSQEEGELTMRGFYKSAGRRFEYNGEEGWLREETYQRLLRKRKLPLARVGVSRREFHATDEQTAKAHEIASVLVAAKLEQDMDHYVVLLSLLPASVTAGKAVLAELASELRERIAGDVRIWLSVQQVAQRDLSGKAKTPYIKHAFEVLEMLIGLRIAHDAFQPVELRHYDAVRLYSDDVALIAAVSELNSVYGSLLSRTSPDLLDEVREKAEDAPRALEVLQLTSNRVNPFRRTSIPVYY